MGPLRNFELKQHKFTTTYVKMQQAYISEAGTVLGNYKVIGYSTPGEGNKTTNFDYTEATRS